MRHVLALALVASALASGLFHAPVASAAEISSFGSVWSGLVERVDGGVAYVRLENCLGLWKGEATSGCAKNKGGTEPVALYFAAERAYRFASPLDLVAASAAENGWLPKEGEHVTVRESFVRACGGNRPDCERAPAAPSYRVERPGALGQFGGLLRPGLIVGGLAAMAGAWAVVRAWQRRGVLDEVPVGANGYTPAPHRMA